MALVESGKVSPLETGSLVSLVGVAARYETINRAFRLIYTFRAGLKGWGKPLVCANAWLWFVGRLGLAGYTGEETGNTTCASPRQTRTREL